MTRLLYLEDAYLKRTRARVVAVEEDGVRLDRTVVYAESGGQAPDHGVLRWDRGEARIVDAQFTGGHGTDVRHVLEDGAARPPAGADVDVELDWERRYGLMRHHTAAHVLAGVMHHEYEGTKFTGGQLHPDRARFDCAFTEWRPELKDELAARVNAVIAQDHAVKNYALPREEFDRADDLLRTAENLIDPGLKEVRITDIEGFDRQADGGTHVARTREVGRFVVDKAENKGKGHRRLHVHVE